MNLLREASELAFDKGKRITPRGLKPLEIRNALKKLGYKSVSKKEFGDADWKGLSPMYFHTKTCTVPEACRIWREAKDVDFMMDQFDDLDEL